jgi:hypothetical protein
VGLERYLQVVNRRNGFAWYEPEVHPAVVSAFLGRYVQGRCYELPIDTYMEWIKLTKMDVIYAHVPWKWGRNNGTDDWGQWYYIGPTAQIGDRPNDVPWDEIHKRLSEISERRTHEGIEGAVYSAPMTAINAIGLETYAMAIAEDRPKLHNWLKEIHQIAMEQLYLILEHPVDIVQVTQMFCDKNGFMFGPQVIEDIDLPFLKEMVDVIHKRGKIVSIHCDGNNEKAYKYLIALGIDVFNGFEGGNQERDMKNWPTLAFHGSVPLEILEQCNSIQVRESVRDRKKALGSHIISSCHYIAEEVGVDNFRSMMEEILDCS